MLSRSCGKGGVLSGVRKFTAVIEKGGEREDLSEGGSSRKEPRGGILSQLRGVKGKSQPRRNQAIPRLKTWGSPSLERAQRPHKN